VGNEYQRVPTRSRKERNWRAPSEESFLSLSLSLSLSLGVEEWKKKETKLALSSCLASFKVRSCALQQLETFPFSLWLFIFCIRNGMGAHRLQLRRGRK